MMMTKVKIVAALLLTVTLFGGGASWFTFRAPAAEPSVPVAKADDKPKGDKDFILGTWQVTGVEIAGEDAPDTDVTKSWKATKWIIAAEKITIVGPEPGEHLVSYKLDSTKKPKEFDYTPLSGRPKNAKGPTEHLIYSLDGDILKVLMPWSPTTDPRPTELATKEGDKAWLITFERVVADKNKPKDEKEAVLPEALPKVRTEAQRARSSRILQDLVIGMMNVDQANVRFPPAAVFDKEGKALLSWRVLILPYIGQAELYKEFRLDEPWDGDHNKKLLEKMPPLFAGEDEQALKNHETYYQGFVGKGAAFEGTKGLHLVKDFPDGTSKTILFVEAKKGVPWTKPEDIPFDADKLLPKLGGLDKDGFLAVMADGSVRFIGRYGKEDLLRTWITRDSGEIKP